MDVSSGCKVVVIWSFLLSCGFVASIHSNILRHEIHTSPELIGDGILSKDNIISERRISKRNLNWSRRLIAPSDIEAQQSELARRIAPREIEPSSSTTVPPPRKIRRMRIHGNPNHSRRIPKDENAQVEVKSNEDGHKVVKVTKTKKRPIHGDRNPPNLASTTTQRPVTTSTTTTYKPVFITANPNSEFGHIKVINTEERNQKVNRKKSNQWNPTDFYREQLRLRGEELDVKPHEHHHRRKKKVTPSDSSNERSLLDRFFPQRVPVDKDLPTSEKEKDESQAKTSLNVHEKAPLKSYQASHMPHDISERVKQEENLKLLQNSHRLPKQSPELPRNANHGKDKKGSLEEEKTRTGKLKSELTDRINLGNVSKNKPVKENYRATRLKQNSTDEVKQEKNENSKLVLENHRIPKQNISDVSKLGTKRRVESLLRNHRLGRLAASVEPSQLSKNASKDSKSELKIPKSILAEDDMERFHKSVHEELAKAELEKTKRVKNHTNTRISKDIEKKNDTDPVTPIPKPKNQRNQPAVLPQHLRQLHSNIQQQPPSAHFLQNPRFPNPINIPGQDFLNPHVPQGNNFNLPNNPHSAYNYQAPFGTFYHQQGPQNSGYWFTPQQFHPYQHSSGRFPMTSFHQSPDLRTLRRTIWDSSGEETDTTTAEATTEFSIPKFEMPSFDFSDEKCQTLIKEVSEVPVDSVPGYRRRMKRSVKSVLLTKECFFPNGIPTKKPIPKDIITTVISSTEDTVSALHQPGPSTEANLNKKLTRRRSRKQDDIKSQT